MKVCSKCKVPKDEKEFSKNSGKKDGLANWCKTCVSERSRVRRLNDVGHRLRQDRMAREYKAKHPDVARRSFLKRLYGLSLEQHKAMYLAQNGCCAICKQPIPYDEVYTDHDHKTGKVRGLLCPGCNTAVGFIEKRQETTYDIFKYLGW